VKPCLSSVTRFQNPIFSSAIFRLCVIICNKVVLTLKRPISKPDAEGMSLVSSIHGVTAGKTKTVDWLMLNGVKICDGPSVQYDHAATD
jgi:hypothetical protein